MVDIDATLFIQLGVFLFMLLVLRTLLFKPVIRLIEARQEATEGAIEAARILEGEAETLNRESTARLDEVRSTAGAERERLVSGARAREREIMEAARAEAHGIVMTMRKETEKVAEETRRRLADDVEAIASMVATKALGRRL